MNESQIERMLHINKLEEEQHRISVQNIKKEHEQKKFENDMETMRITGQLKANIEFYKALSEGLK